MIICLFAIIKIIGVIAFIGFVFPDFYVYSSAVFKKLAELTLKLKFGFFYSFLLDKIALFFLSARDYFEQIKFELREVIEEIEYEKILK